MSKTVREVIAEYLGPHKVEIAAYGDEVADNILRTLDAAGFVIVPKEPTDAMKEAALEVYYSGRVWPKDMVTAYRAMIAAASEPHK